jgi:hypothetical protein
MNDHVVRPAREVQTAAQMRWAALLGVLGGCMVGEPPSPIVALAPTIPGDVFTTLNDPVAAHAELCDPGGDPAFPDHADRITNRFCQDAKPGGVVPTPTSLAEFLHVLDLDFATPGGGNGTDGNPAFAILGHSSALRSCSRCSRTASRSRTNDSSRSSGSGPVSRCSRSIWLAQDDRKHGEHGGDRDERGEERRVAHVPVARLAERQPHAIALPELARLRLRHP